MRIFLVVLIAGVVMFTTTAIAGSNALTLSYGETSPHSENDGGSCLDGGWVGSLSYDKRILSYGEDRMALTLGGTLWHMDYTESDRDEKGDKRTNTHRRTDNIITADARVHVRVWRLRPFVRGSMGFQVGSDYDPYHALYVGLNLKFTKSLSIEAYWTELSNNSTWHRLKIIGLRYEF